METNDSGKQAFDIAVARAKALLNDPREARQQQIDRELKDELNDAVSQAERKLFSQPVPANGNRTLITKHGIFIKTSEGTLVVDFDSMGNTYSLPLDEQERRIEALLRDFSGVKGRLAGHALQAQRTYEK